MSQDSSRYIPRLADVELRENHETFGDIEVRLGQGTVDQAARNLLRIKEKVRNEPSFLAVVTGTEYAYTREDGVHAIPIGCLRDRCHPRSIVHSSP